MSHLVELVFHHLDSTDAKAGVYKLILQRSLLLTANLKSCEISLRSCIS